MPVCPLCPGRFFNDDNAVRMHRESKHGYSCTRCDRVLNSQQALDQHIRDKHTFECHHCDRNFNSEESRQQHEDAVHSAIECRYCDREFNSEEARQQHENAKHAFECRHCDRNFNSEEARQQHEDAKHGAIECRYCDREFNSEEARQQHENAKHVFECHHCDHSFNSEEARQRHEDAVHSAIECRYCDREFNSEEARQQHENAKHVFECRYCDRTFSSENAREQHEDADHSAIECRYCDREFSSEGARKQHEDAKHRFKCNLCGKIFAQLAVLRQHETVPHFECSYCATGFFTTVLKKAHEVSCGRNPANRVCPPLSDQSDGESTPPTSSSCSSQDEGDLFHSTDALPSTDANGEGATTKQPCAGERCTCWICRRTSSLTSDTDKPVPEDAESVESSDESHQDGSGDHRDVTFQCTPCLKLFESEKAFREHVCAFRTIIRRLHCPVCYNQFDDEALLQKHLEGLESFSCQICLTRCCSDEMLQDHLFSHPTCGKCGKSFADNLALCAHVESDHPVVVCWDCDGIVVERNSLEVHYAESPAHPICAFCGVGKRNSADMNEHIRRVHPASAEMESHPGSGDVHHQASADKESRSVGTDRENKAFEHALVSSDAEIGGPLDGPGQNTPLQTESSLCLSPRSPQMKGVDDEAAGKLSIVHGEDGMRQYGSPSPTPSEHGSDVQLFASKVTITATNNDTRPPTPGSSDSGRSLSDLSTRHSPSSVSSNSVVFVSVDGIPDYIRDNRAVLVATSAGTGRTPVRLSSTSSLFVSVDTGANKSPPKTATGTYRVHCRICLVDPCEDMTATMCGHLFCKRCITQALVAKSACPVCGSATLLYCLFKLDLSA